MTDNTIKLPDLDVYFLYFLIMGPTLFLTYNVKYWLQFFNSNPTINKERSQFNVTRSDNHGFHLKEKKVLNSNERTKEKSYSQFGPGR